MSAVTSSRYGMTPGAFHAIEGSYDYMVITKNYTEYTALTMSFSRAYRTNNLQLFIFTLGQMCPICFAGNRPTMLTNILFSRTQVDISLEQTVNAGAATRLT